jgi:hypothetical protein
MVLEQGTTYVAIVEYADGENLPVLDYMGILDDDSNIWEVNDYNFDWGLEDWPLRRSFVLHYAGYDYESRRTLTTYYKVLSSDEEVNVTTSTVDCSSRVRVNPHIEVRTHIKSWFGSQTFLPSGSRAYWYYRDYHQYQYPPYYYYVEEWAGQWSWYGAVGEAREWNNVPGIGDTLMGGTKGSVAVLFPGVDIPEGSTINNATLSFMIYPPYDMDPCEGTPPYTNAEISAKDVGNATLPATPGEFESAVAAKTTATVSLHLDAVAGLIEDPQEIDVTDILSEVTGRSDWVNGGAVLILVDDFAQESYYDPCGSSDWDQGRSVLIEESMTLFIDWVTHDLITKVSIKNNTSRTVSSKVRVVVLKFKELEDSIPIIDSIHIQRIRTIALSESLALGDSLNNQDVLNLMDRLRHLPKELNFQETLGFADEVELLTHLGLTMSDTLAIADSIDRFVFQQRLRDTLAVLDSIEFTYREIHLGLTDVLTDYTGAPHQSYIDDGEGLFHRIGAYVKIAAPQASFIDTFSAPELDTDEWGVVNYDSSSSIAPSGGKCVYSVPNAENTWPFLVRANHANLAVGGTWEMEILFDAQFGSTSGATHCEFYLNRSGDDTTMCNFGLGPGNPDSGAYVVNFVEDPCGGFNGLAWDFSADEWVEIIPLYPLVFDGSTQYKLVVTSAGESFTMKVKDSSGSVLFETEPILWANESGVGDYAYLSISGASFMVENQWATIRIDSYSEILE